eukprot:m.115839 g.115839  ORF g.115839 m.115839 type:complete len:215 (-) comp14216_c0_seq2:133-777(-)
MPLTAITYTQLYGGWQVEPHGYEQVFQLGFSLLAGSKGVTFFQTIEAFQQKESKDWNGIVQGALLSVTNPLVLEIIRTGDINSFNFSTSDGQKSEETPTYNTKSLVQVIRNDTFILVAVVNSAGHGYNNLLCHVYVTDHWQLPKVSVDVAIEVSDDAFVTNGNVTGMVEIADGSTKKPDGVQVAFDGATISLKGVETDETRPLRLFAIRYSLHH